ncbi:MAG: penicillin-binding protein 1A [Gammaproteobacteria bacterium]|nr:penicillin-binding protein 1A [Gammaproteobacteria bacterium]
MRRFFVWLLALTLILTIAGVGVITGGYLYLNPKLPSIELLRETKLNVPLRVFSREGDLIAEFGEVKRTPLTYHQFPSLLTAAVIASEDGNFYQHYGVDPMGLARAVYHLLRTGKKGQGGSTITMQVARNFFLSRKKTYLRKINEILLSIKIEQELSKEEILELYLNKIYLGKRAYGMAAAADVYYGKELAELTLAQVAMLAGLPKAPSTSNPIANPEKALIRRNYVLRRMHELGMITARQRREAEGTEVTAAPHSTQIELEAPYVAEMIRSQMVEQYGEDAYNDGYRVYTTIESKLQRAANAAVVENLVNYEQRHGYRGVEARLEVTGKPLQQQWLSLLEPFVEEGGLLPGVVLGFDESGKETTVGLLGGEVVTLPWAGVSWARRYISVNRRGAAPTTAQELLQPGEVIRLYPRQVEGEEGMTIRYELAQIPQVSGALISLNPDDGATLALVGGFNFYQSKFNRVTQARRQPGSNLKPFIYSAALENGFTTASLINDAPVVFDDPYLEGEWRPENYSGKFFGPTRMRLALTKSRNLVSIRLLRSIGVPKALHQLQQFGFDPEQLPHNLSLALGTASLTPYELVRGYAVLANGGYRVEPYLITHVEDSYGGVVMRANPATVCHHCPEGDISDATAGGVEAEAEAEAPFPAEDPVAEAGYGIPPQKVAPRVVEARNIYLVRSMLQDVIQYGTGRKARELARSDLAGKTGTTNDQRDAWFSGFNSRIVATSWVGFDQPSTLGAYETGGRAALPIWIDYMRVALEGMPEATMEQPPGMVTLRIDKERGTIASADNPDAILEIFREEFAPVTPEGSSSALAVTQEEVETMTRELF